VFLFDVDMVPAVVTLTGKLTIRYDSVYCLYFQWSDIYSRQTGEDQRLYRPVARRMP